MVWDSVTRILPLDPALVGGIVSEIDETSDVGFGDVAVFGSDFGDGIEVGEADVFDVSFGEAVKAFFHAVGEDACDTEDFGACFAEDFDYFDNGAACGDEVFDNDDFLTGEELAFDLVFASVILCTGAYVTHRETEEVRGDRGVSDTCSGSTHEDFGIGIFAAYGFCESIFDVSADIYVRECESVVAVYGGFDSACPCEWFVRAEEYCLDGQEVFCYC